MAQGLPAAEHSARRLQIVHRMSAAAVLSCVLLHATAQLALPLSHGNLASKSEKDLAGMVRSKSVRIDEAEETVVVDVTHLHRKKVRRVWPWTRGLGTHIARLPGLAG
jgi:hypothetical protein